MMSNAKRPSDWCMPLQMQYILCWSWSLSLCWSPSLSHFTCPTIEIQGYEHLLAPKSPHTMLRVCLVFYGMFGSPSKWQSCMGRTSLKGTKCTTSRRVNFFDSLLFSELGRCSMLIGVLRHRNPSEDIYT